jgi:hypothetical protein
MSRSAVVAAPGGDAYMGCELVWTGKGGSVAPGSGALELSPTSLGVLGSYDEGGLATVVASLTCRETVG